MKRRYYFDTSVFGGVFDEEFSRDSIQLFKQVERGKVICVYSKTVEQELQAAPKHVLNFFESISVTSKEKIKSSPLVEELAHEYIRQEVVGSTSLDDCFHIAAATIYEADAIVSWNFKHIVNMQRIPGYNSVNLKCGYKEISIISPKQLVSNGKEIDGY